jgi:FtsP/CotA-like multicopper oxidase with cupredoxin domain
VKVTARRSSRPLAIVVGIVLGCFSVPPLEAVAHDRQVLLDEANRSPYKGADVPGAINLGLSGRPGSYASGRLRDQLGNMIDSRVYGGTYQRSGAQHFGSDPDQDVKLLAPASGESVTRGPRCPPGVSVRAYEVSAINAEITLNAYHDFFPGYMYVLGENVARVRAEEKRNEEARLASHDPGSVSNGLSGDVIQPLAIRVNQGECLVIRLENEVEDERVSLHLHGSSLLVRSTGEPATSTNPDAYVEPGESQSFEWYVSSQQQEGVHHFHSHIRDQASTGLFGTVVVEPRGSRFLDPYTGEELESGWLAMIEDPGGPDFREFVVVYHEVGHEEFRPLDKAEEMIPLRDLAADNYRPSTRALNYRSEAFGNNLQLQHELFGQEDESLAYSSYFFGDPGTPIPRSYLGDPVKWRLVHGGSEVFHSHHLHGGAIRWRRQANLTQDLNLFGTNNFALASDGPIKFPPVRSASDRVDVQTIGPAESHDLVIECGSGGCQYTAGEFLYHCHIPQHYVAGMWSFWRTYNTLQAPTAQTDVMPPLAELPDRRGRMKAAVDSTRLVDRTVRWFGKEFQIVGKGGDHSKGVYSIEDWVEMQLPPQGKPGGSEDEREAILAYDASVWDWAKEKSLLTGKVLYRGEPETTVTWPKYKPEKPGERPVLLFDPDTGKLAWPHMRPHFGKRPPFSPGRNGAPFLEPIHENADGTATARVPRPGENGPWSLCPQESNNPHQIKEYNVHAIHLPITLSGAEGDLPPIVDENGQIYVLHEEEEAIRGNDDLKIPLVLRANVGDCVDVLLSSELPDYDENLYSSKVNMHIHFVQFDTQASDGVITGMSYEQSVRPFNILEGSAADHPDGLPRPQNEVLARAAEAGERRVQLGSAAPFQAGVLVGIGMDQVGRVDIRKVAAIEGDTLLLAEPLEHGHSAGEIVSTEFVRYRWYADADFGITYWHDHAFGLTSWGHGLFGATVIEPRGSTYHHPVTGEPVRSGSIVDIHTNEPVSSEVRGSFREFVLQIQDSNPRTENRIVSGTVPEGRPEGQTEPQTINKLGSMDSWSLITTPFEYLNGGERTSGSSFGLRVEPLARRLLVNPDPAVLFSSRVHGDPDTPLLRAYLGDPVVLRALDHAGNEMHTIHVNGHYFPLERYAVGSRPKSTVHLGIAERYDLVIPEAGGPQKMAGDYLYHSGRISHFGEGMWGILRVLDERVADLRPLPGREEIPESAERVCPEGAPVKTFRVSAIDMPIDLHPVAPAVLEPDSAGTNRMILAENAEGKCYVLDAELANLKAGTKSPSPLVLRANIGDCIEVKLTNRLARGRASFHADMLAYDPADSLGINVGRNRGDQTVAPGKSRTYTFYAHPEYGEAAALVSDWGDVTSHVRDGLYAAIIVGPRGSRYFDPVSGADITLENGWRADVVVDSSLAENHGRRSYRDVALFFQDEDNVIGTSFMPYVRDSAGLAAVNYRAEPFIWRSEKYDCDFEDGFHCNGAPDPVTPLIEAHAGDALRVHVFGAHSEQNTTFSIEGHQWPLEPEMQGAEMLEAEQFGGTEALEVNVTAGGRFGIPGDYVWMSHRLAYAEAGLWGLLRVLPARDGRIAALDSYGAERSYATSGEIEPVRRISQEN